LESAERGTGLAADPRKDAIIALDLEYQIGVEQGGNLGRIPAAADPFQADHPSQAGENGALS
jgi:hypothetical protein